MKNGITTAGSIAVFLVFQLTAMILSGCTKSSSSNTGQGSNQVLIQGYAYNPSSITVPVNTTVTWINKDPVAHTVTSDTGLFDSGSIASGASYSHQFTTAGTYNYHCTIHPYMTGKVTVQ